MTDGRALPAALPLVQGLLLFQRIDGVDLCVFAMYTQESGGGGAGHPVGIGGPARRHLYVAYLDSVEYFRPRTARTSAYHEVLVAYLDWARRCGFVAAHIWACPPQRGNHFVFWCHPPHQRTPSRERLVTWYKAMIQRALESGAVHTCANLYDEYFARFDTLKRRPHKANSHKRQTLTPSELPRETPTCPPVFDGDYWLEEAGRLSTLIERRKGLFGGALALGARALDRADAPTQQCAALLKHVMAQPSAYPFTSPVDPVQLGIPDYLTVISNPMDLGTVQRRLISASSARSGSARARGPR